MSIGPTLLCVLDGFGLNPNPLGNAVAQARKPNFDRIWNSCPHNTLCTHGLRVGLPEGQMGNSEVGHLNIGAGRVVEQWLVRIARAFDKGEVAESTAYRNFLASIKTGGALHLVGLFSDGGVHSDCEHLYRLLAQLKQNFAAQIYLHIITDGRDTSPERARDQVCELREKLKEFPNARIASIVGRFYAMDRDKRWERTKLAFDVLCGIGTRGSSIETVIADSYAKKIFDEFIDPVVLDNPGIKPADGVLFWNFRADRMRQIVRAVSAKDFSDFDRGSYLPPAAVLGFTEYDETFGLPYLFAPMVINNYLGQVVAAQGLKQLRVAETEKYPHVTYFFNGGNEVASIGEDRVMLPSPRDVKTYDLKPEMSAEGVCNAVLEGISGGKYALIVVNFANCDMVGHTGVLSAAIRAVETVDVCLGKILSALEKVNGRAVIIADHGNAEQMINYEDGSPHTSHTMYPVPVVVVGTTSVKTLASDGALCDVAPTILDLMRISQPAEMTGKSLLVKLS